jgi:hypothetical protein
VGDNNLEVGFLVEEELRSGRGWIIDFFAFDISIAVFGVIMERCGNTTRSHAPRGWTIQSSRGEYDELGN